nr:SDR family oxidoreductase [Acidimicrobiales bacterium]
MTGPQRVLITGGASGIGRAMADAFRKDGAMVHVADVDGTADQPPGGGFTEADVSDPSDVDRLFDDVMAGLGGLDVLCANVGIAGPTGPVEELEASDWDRTMAVNVRSAFLCC